MNTRELLNICKQEILSKEYIKLIKKVDSYELVADHDEMVKFRYDLYKKIWAKASLIRKKNKLISYLKEVRCSIKSIMILIQGGK